MKLRYFGVPIFALLMVLLSVVSSCKEEWDNHYNATAGSKSDLNLYEYIQSREELQKFTQMLKMLGYDTILNQSRTFTVWAPVNLALDGIDLRDTLEVRRIVTNHIADFSHSTVEINSKGKVYRMLNNKLLSFTKNTGLFFFDGNVVTEPDLATANGIVHILGGYSAYKKNFWEFIAENPNLDSVQNYINSLTTYVLDEDKSYDSDNILVDSIFKRSNFILDYLAQLENEDSVYTAILPTNAAWRESYHFIFPYFKTPEADGDVKMQEMYAKNALTRDLFFYGKLDLPIGKDTLRSIYGTDLSQPDNLFPTTPKLELSNGNCYVTDQLNYKPSESWLKPIRVEGERIRDVTFSNYSISSVSSYGTGFDISKRYYLRADPTATSDLSSLNSMSLRFELPGTLSTRYNVYCVFVPGTIVDTLDKRPAKVKFFVSYLDKDGNQTKDLAVNQNHELTTSTAIPGAYGFDTDPTKLDKMLVLENFEFPYSNILTFNPQTLTYSPATTYLRVNNASRVKDVAYTRTLRIDCIILEPVQ